MKKFIVLSGFILICNFSFSQWIKNVQDFWWRIEENCFTGTPVTRHNSLFMSTVNNAKVGSIYHIQKNITGRMVIPDEHTSYDGMRTRFAGYPDPAKPSASAPCPFVYRVTVNDTVAVNDLLKALPVSLNSEIKRIIKKSVALDVSIANWGYDKMELGDMEEFFRRSRNDEYVRNLRAVGDKYVVLGAIWVEGVNISFNLDRTAMTRISELLNTEMKALKEAGVTIDLKNEKVLTTSFNSQHRFYPFFRFARITQAGDLKTIIPQTLDDQDVDFIEVNSGEPGWVIQSNVNASQDKP